MATRLCAHVHSCSCISSNIPDLLGPMLISKITRWLLFKIYCNPNSGFAWSAGHWPGYGTGDTVQGKVQPGHHGSRCQDGLGGDVLVGRGCGSGKVKDIWGSLGGSLGFSFPTVLLVWLSVLFRIFLPRSWVKIPVWKSCCYPHRSQVLECPLI